MNSKMKKIFAIMLACLMLITCVPFSASAVEIPATAIETVNSPVTVNDGETLTVSGTYTVATTLTVFQGGNVVVEDGGSIIFAGENGKLFGSVTSKEISNEIKKALGIEIDKKKMSVADIKNFGEYTAEIKLYTGISAKLTVKVTE